MFYVRKLFALFLLTMFWSVSALAQDSQPPIDDRLPIFDGLKFIEMEHQTQKLVTFNVSSRIRDAIENIVEKHSITLAQNYSVREGDLLLYVFEYTDELAFLPDSFKDADKSSKATGAYTLKSIMAKKVDGTQDEITALVAVRELAINVTDAQFDCQVVKIAAAALIARKQDKTVETAVKFLELTKQFDCDFEQS